jgi:CBS domain-containing protein
MFIRNCLTPKEEIVTVTPETTLKETLDLLQEHGLDSIPVVDSKGLFLGITGYRHIFKALLEEEAQSLEILGERKVSDALYPIDPLTVDSDFEDTFPIIVYHPFVPVVDEDGFTFLGIVKISDIEAVLTTTYGHGVPGVRFLLGVLIDAPHELEHITECIKPYDVNIITVVTFDAGDAVGRRILLKIEPTPHTEEIRQNLEKKGFRVLSVKEVGPS